MQNKSNILSTGFYCTYVKILLESPITLFLRCLLVVIIIYVVNQPISIFWLKPAFLLAGFLVLVFKRSLSGNPLFWFVWFIYFCFTLGRNYYLAANHHFVFCYLLAAVIIHQITAVKIESYLTFQVRFLLLAILLLSAFQKLLSPSFMSGAFFQLEINLNYFLKPLQVVLTEWQTHTNENKDLYKTLMATNPNENLTVQLKNPIIYSALFAKSMSIMAIIMEAIAGIAIFCKPHHILSHLLLIGMIGGIFFFRLETGFLALLSAMGLLLSPSRILSLVYLISILTFSIFMATALGLR